MLHQGLQDTDVLVITEMDWEGLSPDARAFYGPHNVNRRRGAPWPPPEEYLRQVAHYDNRAPCPCQRRVSTQSSGVPDHSRCFARAGDRLDNFVGMISRRGTHAAQLCRDRDNRELIGGIVISCALGSPLRFGVAHLAVGCNDDFFGATTRFEAGGPLTALLPRGFSLERLPPPAMGKGFALNCPRHCHTTSAPARGGPLRSWGRCRESVCSGSAMRLAAGTFSCVP